ncbi:MAG: hypothetical protein RL562_440 [Planctomycetota bacterium]
MQTPNILRIASACALSAALSAPSFSQEQDRSVLRLQFATFDPLVAAPEVPTTLRASDSQRLWIVQFAARPTQADRDAIAALGGQLHSYLPELAYVVRIDAAAVDALEALPSVRWMGRYHPAFRIDPKLVAAGALKRTDIQRYNVVVADKRTDKPALAAKVNAIGGAVADEHTGSLLFSVLLTGDQLAAVAGFDEVLWIDAWTPDELDVDNARIQGGANHIETQGGFTGAGIGAHIYEGIEATHPDFTGGAVNVRSAGGADNHGHATAGIVFGNGWSNPAVRGLAPDATKFFTQYGSVTGSRYQVVQDLVQIHGVSHTTASWGSARTTTYTSVSAEADDIVFDHDITWTQSQSNAGNQDSRPQAWAKNVFSIGGVRHNSNANPLDDSYLGGGASRGPAADGRIKPDLCAYYEGIGTSDRTGAAGYSANDWYASFGGTSGATPIVAGHNVLAIQMFTDESATPGFGRFGNALRNPGGTAHSNRPHFTTMKAMMTASARQYAFTAASTDNRREHQGWGFPNLQTLWDNRDRMLVVDETDVLTQGQATRWDITVAAGEPSLRISMNYADPAANPAAAKTLINDLSIRVTAPNGTVYWGNAGLEDGNWSTSGGAEDDINPIECVFVQNPAPGVWHVDVKATLVATDSHVETPAVDADYGLVVIGGTGQRGTPPVFASFDLFGQACPGSVQRQPGPCAELNPNGGTLTGATRTWEYCHTVNSAGALQVVSFDLFTRTTNGTTQTVPAHIYAAAGGGPATTPLASTTITVGPVAGFYTATFAAPVNVNGTFYVSMDSSSQLVVLSQLAAGAGGQAFYRAPVNGTWTQSGLVTQPSWRVTCGGGSQFASPALANDGMPNLGNSYRVTLADALASAPGALLSGLSNTTFGGTPLPVAIPGAPGCSLLVAPEVADGVTISATGTADRTFAVPSSSNLLGVSLYHQWLVFDAVNPSGIVVSEGGRAKIGN